MKQYLSILAVTLIGLFATSANAVPIVCQVVTNNHMTMDSTEASACIAAGVGNINQNTTTDAFLTSGGTTAGYTGAGVASSFTQDGSTGTWSVASAVDTIGFKFGTGNQPDEWFIFDLADGVTSGSWTFINVYGRGGGLSHMETYCKDGCDNNVPEPGVMALLGAGLLGMVVVRRRTRI